MMLSSESMFCYLKSTDIILNRVTDAEAVAMSRYLVLQDGLFLGSSSAVNLVACVRMAKQMTKGDTITTILCDSGSRHVSFFNVAGDELNESSCSTLNSGEHVEEEGNKSLTSLQE